MKRNKANFIQVLFYDLFIHLLQFSITIAALFNPKAALWITGRKNWRDKIKATKFSTGKRLWFHCASLGEFEQCRPVIEQWKKDHPDDSITLTFFSPSGYEIRKDYPLADLVLYLPLDTPANAKDFAELVRPDLALFAKYDLWYHYLSVLNQKSIPIILFSSVFRSQQAFFAWYGRLFRVMLQMLNKIFVQDEKSLRLLEKISIVAEVNPDTRFDRVYEVAQNPKPFPLVQSFKNGHKIFIAGSTWQKDEALLFNIIQENILTGYKYIIAPHQISAERIAQLQQKAPVKSVLLSQITEANATSAQLLIIDSIGHLSSLYALADIAYVGGGFNTSVHNILEPAAYGMPVLFGPNHSKPLESSELINRCGAFSFYSYTNLVYWLNQLQDPHQNRIAFAALQSKQYVTEMRGGAKNVCTEMQKQLR